MEASAQPDAAANAPRASMKSIERYLNLGAVILPFVATIAAIVLFWNEIVSTTDLVIFAVMYLLTATGVTVGYHRLLTHRSFQTYPAIS
jgi:stearoyl-CoA desaturase (delta-9 desaturase)